MQVVILAGGFGTRMRHHTAETPKALIPVAGAPFAHHQLALLAKQGITQVLYSIGYLGEHIREFVGDGSAFGIDVQYVDEGGQLRGTAGALRLAADAGLLSAEFGVLYGDSYLPIPLDPVWAAFRSSGRDALMTVTDRSGLRHARNVVFDGERVVRYEKNLDPPPTEMRFIDYGISALRTDAVRELVPPDKTTDLSSLFGALATAGRLTGYAVSDRFYEVGSDQGLADLERFLRSTTRAAS